MANLAVQLLNNWAAYEQLHPTATLNDFYLTQLQEQQLEQVAGGTIETCLRGRQAELKIKNILKQSLLSSANELLILYSITNATVPQKGKVIKAAGMETTTGTDVCARLINGGFITEQPAYGGGNIKMLQLTPRGTKALKSVLLTLGHTL